MNAEGHANESPSTDGEDSLSPREAADLLERSQREARRKLTSDTPLLSVFSALVVLAIYGAIWSSSRGQHPYTGPSLDVIGLVYILVAVAALRRACRCTSERPLGSAGGLDTRPAQWRSRSSSRSSASTSSMVR